MITKEAIEAAARAACEDNVQRIHKAAHDSGSSASMSGSEYYMFPPHGWPDFLASIEAAFTAALAAMPGPAVKVKPLEWVKVSDGRYSDGFRPGCFSSGHYRIAMRNGVDFVIDDGLFTFFRQRFCSPDAAKAAAQADYESRIRAAIEPAPDLASENERLRAALDKLVKSANEVNRLGASTGPQWMKMTVAIVSAKAALERT